MTHPNYSHWTADVQDQYDKTAKMIKKHGHTIKGIKDLRLAYTLAHLSVLAQNFFLFSLLAVKVYPLLVG